MFYSPQQGWVATITRALAYTSYGDRDRVSGEDHYAHAPGHICSACGHTIEPWQYARRRGKTNWAHDVCPPLPAVKRQIPVVSGWRDRKAAGRVGRGRVRASDADRELVIDTLKSAFVQGRLTKDEFCLRVGHALASRTYADLAVVTADIPTEVAAINRGQAQNAH
jgi:Domain of unknown function (DUF1707)